MGGDTMSSYQIEELMVILWVGDNNLLGIIPHNCMVLTKLRFLLCQEILLIKNGLLR